MSIRIFLWMVHDLMWTLQCFPIPFSAGCTKRDCDMDWLSHSMNECVNIFLFQLHVSRIVSCGTYTFCVGFSILFAQICSDYMLFYFLVTVAFICTSFKTFIFRRELAVLQNLIISPWLSINLYTFQRVRMTQNLTQLKSWCHFFSYILCQFISQMQCMAMSTHK